MTGFSSSILGYRAVLRDGSMGECSENLYTKSTLGPSNFHQSVVLFKATTLGLEPVVCEEQHMLQTD